MSLTLISCSSVTIDLRGHDRPLGPPSFVDFRNYYFFGLFNRAHVSVGKACLDQVPVRLKSYASTEDILFSLFSLGLYTPRTVKVWCEDPLPPVQPEGEAS